ncbi:MAG: BPL-N domain-containing protein [Nitrospirota bacterium]|nr:BPL-N domain-containing protein [Nitrospirota bacterium]
MQASGNTQNKGNSLPEKRFAFLWDESFLWGLMAYKALKSASLPFELIRAEDIRKGGLAGCTVLFVPGGWASNKVKALGDSGVAAIRNFVRDGGHYLGFCGGAGLATQDGIGLLDIKRRPTRDRVPSFSGRIRLNTNGHSLWSDIGESIFHAWWPSQFVVEGSGLKILATYGEALPDAFSSDLNTGDVSAYGDWAELEKIYGINLDPKRLLDEPAVVEGTYGKGSVILSLVHFDTPDDANGMIALKNLWKNFAAYNGKSNCQTLIAEDPEPAGRMSPVVEEIQAAVSELISLGIRNFLWFWRNPALLQWRRGVRGLEYCTLYILINEIASLSHDLTTDEEEEEMLVNIRGLLFPFVEKAKRLLLLERTAMSDGHITYEACDAPQIQALRKELFSTSKSHGGLFKELISEVDNYLYCLISTRENKLR